MKDEKSAEEKVKIIKHPTQPIWGTKEGLEEYEKACKDLRDRLEREFWWGKPKPIILGTKGEFECGDINKVFYEDAPNTEGIVRKSDEAPTSIPTDPQVFERFPGKYTYMRGNFSGGEDIPNCSYCDYTPCRCKNEDYGK